MVDRVRRNRKDSALRKVVRTEGYARAGWNDAREAEGGGAVDAEGFGYDVAEAGEGD